MVKKHKNFLKLLDNIQLSIGDVSDGIGVSQRQLRYWEEKGYIKPISDNEKGVRKYNFLMAGRCAQIKEYLDEGYTLSKAYEKTIEVEEKRKVIRNFLSKQHGNFEVEITDSKQSFGEIDLGATGEGKELYGIVNADGVKYELR